MKEKIKPNTPLNSRIATLIIVSLIVLTPLLPTRIANGQSYGSDNLPNAVGEQKSLFNGIMGHERMVNNQSYTILSRHSGLCLDVAGWSTNNGAKILQWECHGGANQQFEFIRQHNGYYLIRSVHSGLCLDVAGWSMDNSARILQWECHGGANQQFRSQGVNDDTLPDDLWYSPVMIRSKHSGLCLDVAAWSTSNGAEIIQWQCHGGANQQFWGI